jgi:hypothetical protein
LTLSAAELEEQIIDFLSEKYRSEPAVLAALTDRRARRQGTFVRWIEDGLSAYGLAPKLVESLGQDIVTVCESIARPHGNPAGLICR